MQLIPICYKQTKSYLQSDALSEALLDALPEDLLEALLEELEAFEAFVLLSALFLLVAFWL